MSTNYYNVFIEVADDCRATESTFPPTKGNAKTVASLEHELISSGPYQHTSDDVVFRVYAIRNAIAESALAVARERYFSNGRPCFRASPLSKIYGRGIHSNRDGKIALVGLGTEQYSKLLHDPDVEKKKAMRSKKR